MSKQPKKPDASKKSKDVKGKTVSAEKLQNTTYLEIVPGKFNENDWNNLLDIDESQEFIWELLDECIENANKVIHTKYLDNQTIPFTINEAKKAILHLIDWQFLDNDEDDDITEDWAQDKEPDSCMIDSWAQGYVQTIANDIKDFEKQIIVEEVDEQKSSGNLLEELIITPYNDKTQLGETTSNLVTPRLNESKTSSVMTNSNLTKSCIQHKPEKDRAKNLRAGFNRRKKLSEQVSLAQGIPSSSKPDHSLLSFDVNDDINESDKENKKNALATIHAKFKQADADAKKLDESIFKAPNACQSLLKTLLTRPVGQREVELDSFGDISSMVKLDFDKVKTGIKTRFTINEKLQTDVIDLNSRKSRIDRKNASKNSSIKDSSATSLDRALENRKLHQKAPRKKPQQISEAHEEEDLVLDPVPGVVFTMLNSVRVGPKKTLVPNRQQQLYDKSEIFLKPIKPHERSDSMTRISLEEILESNHEISSATKNANSPKNNKLKPMPPITHAMQI